MSIASMTPRTPSAHAYPLLLRQLLNSALAYSPGQEIVYRDRVRHDYATLRQRVGRLASLLRGLGIGPGDAVAMMDWDSHRYLEAYFAVPMMGAVLMTVNVRLSPAQIAYTIKHSRARVLVVNAEFMPMLQGLIGHLDEMPTLVCIDERDERGEPALPPGCAGEYESLLAAADPAFAFEEFDENTPATLFYTTGTTGDPKGVCFSHRQLVLHTLALSAALCSAPQQGRLSRDDVYMPMTPMFHVHAWGLPYLATMLGLKQVYPGRYVPQDVLGLMAREKVSFSHCVPTLLQMLLSSPAAAHSDLRGWKCVIGGAALPRGLAAAACSRGIDVFSGYGMSESCPVLTLAQIKPALQGRDGGDDVELRTRSGYPIPLVELRIVDEHLHDVARDGSSTGEIVARAPWLTQGYVGNTQASEALWRGSWLHTGDIGVVDGDGYLRVTDRVKDVIKSGGEWVSSLALEDLISHLPAVGEAAVIGVSDALWGERPLALVVPRSGHTLDAAAVLDHLQPFVAAGQLSRYALPRQVLVVEAIDKTSVGKIDKKLLRSRYAP